VVSLAIVDGDAFLGLEVPIPNIVTIVIEPMTLLVTIGLSMVCLKVITKTSKLILLLLSPLLVWLIEPHLLPIFVPGKDDKVEGQFGFSRKQYEALHALIQQSQNDYSPIFVVHQCTTKPTIFVFPFSSWILDSGSTNNIYLFKYLFQNLKPISPIFIQLPNQNSVIAKLASTIVLGNLIFHNTFFVPKFSFELISIPKLLNYTNFFMVFFQNTCLIVQPDTFQTIGATRKHQGMFYLLDSSQDMRNLSISNTNISLPHVPKHARHVRVVKLIPPVHSIQVIEPVCPV